MVRCDSTAVSSRKMDDVDDVLVPSHINLITGLDEFFFSRSDFFFFFLSKCKAPSTVCLFGTQKSLPVGKKQCHTHVYSNNIPFRTPHSFSLSGPQTTSILWREDAQICCLKKHTPLQEKQTSRRYNICSIFWQLIKGKKTPLRKRISTHSFMTCTVTTTDTQIRLFMRSFREKGDTGNKFNLNMSIFLWFYGRFMIFIINFSVYIN